MSSNINHLIQQTQTKFQSVDDSQQMLHARDLEILRSNLQSHIAQTRAQDAAAIQAEMQTFQAQVIRHTQALEARIEALTQNPVQHDPWFQSRYGAAPRHPSEGAAAQSGIPGAADLLGQWYVGEGAQNTAPIIPPGIPGSWEPPSKFSPDLKH